MFDKFFVGRDVLSSSNNGKYKPISRVTLLLDDANSVTAGDDTGYEIVSNCPNATQEIANDLLASLKGHEYQAYTADGANLDPSAELGDGITVDGLYSVISRVQDNGSGYSSISAPGEAEWEGDFPMDGPLTQMFNQAIKKVGASITKTAEEIRLDVSASEKAITDGIAKTLENYATLGVTDSKIAAAVGSSKEYTDGQLTEKLKDYATLELTTDSIEASVQSSKDYTDETIAKELESYATLEVTDSKISTAVSTSEKTIKDGIATQLREYSTTAQTAVAISWEVGQLGQSIDGKLQNYSTQTQTATAIASAVNGLVDGAYVKNSITTALDGITLSASNSKGSTTLQIKSGSTVLDTKTLKLTVDAANITGTLTIGQLPLDIATTGDIPTSLSELTNDSKFVTERGVTTIVDGYVTTDYLRAVGIKAESIVSGTIYADRNIVLDGLMKIVNGPYSGYLGVNYGKGGAVICNSGMDVFVIANDDAAKLSYKEEKRIWVHNSGCYSSETMKIYSDRTLKDAISYDLTAEEKLFTRLRPCSFVYQNDQSQKKHWGFIAQEFIESAEEVALDTDSLAVVGQYDGKYSLGYGEITALNTHMIQLLMKRVEALESK